MSEQHNPGPVVAIVVAAGSGSRLSTGVPKALVAVGGVPLVVRAVRQLAAGGVQRAVVVVPESTQADFDAALADAGIPVSTVAGGEVRQDSVVRGISALGVAGPDDIVLVHDAARAFVPADVVARVIEAVRAGADAVVPVVPVTDSIREVREDDSVVVERSGLRAVQTPQGFPRDVLEEGHRALAENETVVTDDAAAAEYVGRTVTLVEGAREAFKVTDPFDLAIAEVVAGRQSG